MKPHSKFNCKPELRLSSAYASPDWFPTQHDDTVVEKMYVYTGNNLPQKLLSFISFPSSASHHSLEFKWSKIEMQQHVYEVCENVGTLPLKLTRSGHTVDSAFVAVKVILQQWG